MSTTNATIELENIYTSGVYGKRPVAIVRGSGALVWDAEGREFIDCTAGHGVANIGHGRTEIAAAIAAQAQRLITCPEIFYNDARARLLARLAHIVPEGITKFFLCNSGTEAVEGALKFARIATGRAGIVAAFRGFHGRTMGALSTTWEPHYRDPFAPLIPGVSHIRYNDLAAANAAINEGTAAVILELVQGEGGVHVACEEYIHGLVSLCRERGALLIVDEVQTGFGRTGRLFACQHYDLQPDILCLAKSLAGGVPMGAIGLSHHVVESGRITRGIHGSSFGGNPLACAAALATLDILEQETLPAHAASLGEYALERLRAVRSPLIREVRGRGLLIGVELMHRAQPYLESLIERGVLALPAGPNVIRLLPPLVISQEQLERVLAVLEEVLLAEVPAGSGTGEMKFANLAPESLAPARGATTSGEFDQNSEVLLLQNMLTIPSYSCQERVLAQHLVEQAQQLGLYSYVDDVGNLIASTHPCDMQTRSQSTILLGHMDTVQGYIPVRLTNGVLYGRGAVDAKGPLAAFLCAAGRLARFARTDSFRHPIVVIGAVEEESASSRGARAVVERYQPGACIIGEPSGSQAVTIGYKGRLLVEYCAMRPVHHSAGSQRNGNEVAVAFWIRVRNHASQWNEQYAANSTFAALIPTLRSISSSQDGLVEETQLLIGYRLPPNYDVAGLRTQLKQWVYEDEASMSFSGEEAAFQTTRTTPLSRTFMSAIRATGRQPTFKLKTGTSDMNVVGPTWGQNIVAYGPGDSHLDHTPDEHIHIAEYIHAIDVLEMVLKELVLPKETTS
jgi:predicted acetylornithine/succinylornithine family transaminase/N-acetyl-ornithine/N-acetyl-lysine deacetylase